MVKKTFVASKDEHVASFKKLEAMCFLSGEPMVAVVSRALEREFASLPDDVRSKLDIANAVRG